MLQNFFRRLGKTPDKVTSQDVLAFADGRDSQGVPADRLALRQGSACARSPGSGVRPVAYAVPDHYATLGYTAWSRVGGLAHAYLLLCQPWAHITPGPVMVSRSRVQ